MWKWRKSVSSMRLVSGSLVGQVEENKENKDS
jgi:hypothetical protein